MEIKQEKIQTRLAIAIIWIAWNLYFICSQEWYFKFTSVYPYEIEVLYILTPLASQTLLFAPFHIFIINRKWRFGIPIILSFLILNSCFLLCIHYDDDGKIIFFTDFSTTAWEVLSIAGNQFF
ncbi:MAG: hypothetical protein ACI85I_002814, partial [Arenicella sp.]